MTVPTVRRVPPTGHDAVEAFESEDGRWIFERYRASGWMVYAVGNERPAWPFPFSSLDGAVEWAYAAAAQ